MPSRSSDSARRSPTPLRNLTGVSRRTAEAAGGAIRGLGSLDCCFREKSFGEPFGIEWFQVFYRFSETNEPDWKVEFPTHSGNCTSTCAAIQLRDHDPGGRNGLGKELSLLNRVLANRSVEDQQCLMRGTREPSADHADDLSQLLHQALLRMEAARGIDNHRVDSA